MDVIYPIRFTQKPYRKLNINIIDIEFSRREYTLISTEYVGAHSKLQYICPKHPDKGILEITYAHFQQGRGCKYCGLESRSNLRRHPYDHIKSEFNKKGYILVSNIYVNSLTKLQYICPKHQDKGILEITYADLQRGHGCWYCGKENFLGLLGPTLAEKNREQWKNIDAIIYFIRCYNDEETFYKIGITKASVGYRFSSNSKMPYNYDILKEINTNLYDAVYLEEYFHEKHKDYKYIPKCEFGGYTECFSEINI